MKKTICLLLSLAVLLAFAGCGESPSQNDGSSLTVGEAVDFASFDPFGIFDGQGFYRYSTMVYETLTNYENGEAMPGLAESWENDGTTWTFHLKEGVKFTDGADFNAEAVKVNIEKIHEFLGEYIGYYGAVSRIVEVEIIDDHTVRFVYDAPYYAVLQELSASCFGIVSPNLFVNGNNPYGNTLTESVGTGPYRLLEENCVSGKSYLFTRNEGWHGTASGPDSCTVKIIPDADSRMMALEAGEIDLLFGSYQITYDMMAQFADSGKLETVFSERTYLTRNLILNAAAGALDDLNVRKAIQHAVNKQQIIDTVLHGHESVANTLFAADLPHCDIDLHAYEYDRQRAISLLEEAGWTEINAQGVRVKNGEALSLEATYQSSRPVDEQVLMGVKGQLAEVGIGLVIQGYETMTWFEKGVMGEFDISVNDTYGFPQDPHVFLTAMLDDGLDKASQQGLAQKAEIDSHITSMMQTVDEAVIDEDYRYILTTLHEEAVNVPISFSPEMVVYHPDVVAGFSFSDNLFLLDITRIVMK